MVEGSDKADVTQDFLRDYFDSFRFLSFADEASEIRSEYVPVLQFVRWSPVVVEDSGDPFNKVGGVPYWYLGDEEPASFPGESESCFLMQLLEGYEFRKEPDAPRQTVLKYSNNGGVIGDEPSLMDEYELFLANSVYIFGPKQYTEIEGKPVVYVIVQH